MTSALTSKELFAIFAAIVQSCTVVACGGGASTGSDGGSSGSSSSGACGTVPPPEKYTVPFVPRTDCIDASAADAGDAGDDGEAGVDASIVQCDSESDPTLCQRHCTQSPIVGPMNECALSTDKKTVTCTRQYLCGRRFEGLPRLTAVEPSSSLGMFAAESAYLEAASVHAFRWLAEEIDAHGLGAELAAWARRAAREEAQHARMMTSLARSLGVERAPRVQRPARRTRSLEDIAIENVVEGCVRETYGALLATFQATHAEDQRLRAVFARIAKDETSHAALAWSLAGVIEARLDDVARRRLQSARIRAFSELRETLAGLTAYGNDAGARLSRDDRTRLGLPSAIIESQLVRSLEIMLLA